MVGCISQEIDVGNCDLRASFEVGAQPHFHQDSLDLCAGFRYTYPSCVSFPDGFGDLVGRQNNRGSWMQPISKVPVSERPATGEAGSVFWSCAR
jgi:hypothetical protein